MIPSNQVISENRTLLMGVAMFSILLFHQGWIWGWNPFFAFFHFYGNWGVDIFFFVSGFGLYYSLKKDGRIFSFYKRRVVRMLPLCLICGLFRYICDHILPVGVSGYPTGMHEVSSDWMTIFSFDIWFIPAILLFYLLMPFMFKLINNGHGVKLMICAYFVALISLLTCSPDWIRMCSDRFPVFCIGAIVAAQWYDIGRFKYIGYIAICVALIYKFLIMMGISDLPEFTYLILSFGIVELCSTIIKGMKGCMIFEGGMRFFCFLGNHSLEIFLLHVFVYRYIYRFLIGTPIPLLIQLIIGVVVSIALAAIFSKISSGIVKVLIRQ